MRLLLALLCAVALAFTSCSKKESPASSVATSRVLAGAEVVQAVGGAFTGDASYAQVSSSALPALYAKFREEIFRHGVVKWDSRFDCNHFAAYYVSLAQTDFYLANFQSRTPAQSLAVGTYWYQSPRGAHAIVVALTERGPVWIEPQTGNELFLTAAQRASAWLKVF